MTTIEWIAYLVFLLAVNTAAMIMASSASKRNLRKMLNEMSNARSGHNDFRSERNGGIVVTGESHGCKYCEEDARKKILGIKITFHYENPEAYGFPEKCYWDDEYHVDSCPFCGRKIISEYGEEDD